MTKSREMSLIGGVVKLLREEHSWTGETHIQKTAYIAKMLRDVPFESEFVLYKHGPFSFDMSKSLVHMRSRSLLSISPNPGYGPTFEVNLPLWAAVERSTGGYFAQFEGALREVCSFLGNRNVGALERLATAVFLNAEHPNASVDEKAEKMISLKPHILRALAISAFEEVTLI